MDNERARAMNDWAAGLVQRLSNNAPAITGDGMRQSRRLEGQFSYDREIEAYHAVMFYIQKGLAAYQDIITKLLMKVVAMQNDCERGTYHLCLFLFGSSNHLLSHDGKSIKVIDKNISYSVAIKRIMQLSGNQPPDNHVIGSFFPIADPYGTIRGVTSDDLLVFIYNKEIVFHSSLQNTTRSIQKHSLFVNINDGNPEWAMPKPFVFRDA
jgi:hypothetical protein